MDAVAARGTLRELLRDSPLFREVWHDMHSAHVGSEPVEPAE